MKSKWIGAICIVMTASVLFFGIHWMYQLAEPLENSLQQHTVEPSIAPLVNPTLVSVPRADTYLDNEGMGIVLAGSGPIFFPHQILAHHQVVNIETLKGTLSVRFQPQLFASEVWMDNERVPFSLRTWNTFKSMYPYASVLGTQDAEGIEYLINPYSHYHQSPEIWYPVTHKDARLPSKQVVYGSWDGTVAYTQQALEMANIDTARVLPMYWFAWFNMHPETKLIN